MRSLKKLGQLLAVGACVVTVLAISADPASARPKYKTEFGKLYPELVEKLGKAKVGCGVCHPNDPVKKKKARNNYGLAVKKNLKKPNEGDAAAIKKALEEAAKGKSHVDGMTFGDLIKAGKLPGDDKTAAE